LNEIQRRLNQDTTLISYYVASEKLLAFVVTKATFQVMELHPKNPDFSDAVEALPATTSASHLPAALAIIYKTLIKPIKPNLKTKALIIVPDLALYNVPFGALAPTEAATSAMITTFHTCRVRAGCPSRARQTVALKPACLCSATLNQTNNRRHTP